MIKGLIFGLILITLLVISFIVLAIFRKYVEIKERDYKENIESNEESEEDEEEDYEYIIVRKKKK